MKDKDITLALFSTLFVEQYGGKKEYKCASSYNSVQGMGTFRRCTSGRIIVILYENSSPPFILTEYFKCVSKTSCRMVAYAL